MGNFAYRTEALNARHASRLGQPLQRAFNATSLLGGMVVLAMILLIAIAGFLPFTRKVVAIGTVVPVGGIIEIRAPEHAVVTKVHVLEGQPVSPGERLFTLSLGALSKERSKAAESAAESSKIRLASILRELETIELNHQKNKALIASRFALMLSEQRSLAQELEITNSRLKRQKKLVTRLLAAEKTGAISNAYMQDQKDRADEIRLQALQVQERQNNSRHSESLLRSELAVFDTNANVTTEQLNREALQLQETIAQESAQRTYDVTATSAGFVSHVRAVAGQTVSPTNTLCYVAAEGKEWLVLLQVSQQFATDVQVGQRVTVFDPETSIINRAPSFGIVQSVSRIATTPQQPEGESHSSNFVAIVRLNDSVGLHAGVVLEGKIEIESRSLLAWLFKSVLTKPIQKNP